ncbi:sulfotransferase 1C4-like [Glandiceps talaboti]
MSANEEAFKPGENHVYNGVVFPSSVPASTLEALKNFEVREDDVFIATYPKSGTTMMQEMLSLIYNDCDVSKIKDVPLYLRMPFLENDIVTPDGKMVPVYPMVNQMPSPRVIKTHLPYELTPPKVFEKKVKVIYVSRNPKDTAVSYYHFHHWNNMLQTIEKWDDFVERFVEGKVAWGSWFDHVLGYWNHRNDGNILFLQFADLKKDLPGQVRKIADFLGKPLTEEQIKIVSDWCSFENMSKHPNSNLSCIPKQFYNANAGPFMRKGSVGGWTDTFTPAQNDKLNALYDEKMKDSGLDFPMK